MKGNPKIIASLNELLAGELTAMDVYFLHAHMCEDWGLSKLYAQFHHEQSDEAEHAAALIRRILFLEGRPNVVARDSFQVGASVPEILENDLALEYDVARNLKRAIALCEAEGDFVTRSVLDKLLYDTEQDHILWFETQLGLLKQLGTENYLQSMV